MNIGLNEVFPLVHRLATRGAVPPEVDAKRIPANPLEIPAFKVRIPVDCI